MRAVFLTALQPKSDTIWLCFCTWNLSLVIRALNFMIQKSTVKLWLSTRRMFLWWRFTYYCLKDSGNYEENNLKVGSFMLNKNFLEKNINFKMVFTFQTNLLNEKYETIFVVIIFHKLNFFYINITLKPYWSN